VIVAFIINNTLNIFL